MERNIDKKIKKLEKRYVKLRLKIEEMLSDPFYYSYNYLENEHKKKILLDKLDVLIKQGRYLKNVKSNQVWDLLDKLGCIK